MIQFFKKYLQINTAHPVPNYRDVCTLFTQQAQADGFEFTEILLSSGLPVFVITYAGTDSSLPALALNHHMDVVPVVDEKAWTYLPFSGHLEQGIIYGRGTQDMKGVGLVHYWALKKIKEECAKLKRTVHLILVPHEEIGGFDGAGKLVETAAFKKLNIGFVLDEGLSSGNDHALRIKVSERKPLQIKLTSQGDMAHGSRISCTNAIHELVAFLSKVATFQKNQQSNKKDPFGLLLSMNTTSFNAGIVKDGHIALNVVPSTATATIDIRVPPTMTLQQARVMLDEMLNGFSGITYTVEAQVQERPFNQQYKTHFYTLLEKTINKQHLKGEPYFAEESSDMRFYLEQGIEGLGLTPFTIKDNIHGIDECVSVKDLECGTLIFADFLKVFCLEAV